MKVELEMTGTTPLMMHNVQTASPLNKYAKELKKLNAKRTKTDDDRMHIARVEWEAGLYFDNEAGPYLPTLNIFKCLIEGARLSKAGKKVERGVRLLDTQSPIDYEGPRDIEGLWSAGKVSDVIDSPFVDLRTVTVQRQRIDRCRPIFPQWSVRSSWLLDPSIIEFDDFSNIADTAGQLIGVGDFRLLYGHFEALVKEV